MSNPTIQAPTEPDPSVNNDWVGATGDYPPRGTALNGVVRIRETRESKFGEFEALGIEDEDGVIQNVPGFRSHLKELIAKNDPRPGDEISVVFFGVPEGGKKVEYAMRVAKNGSTPDDFADGDVSTDDVSFE
ncbi:MAG: hypothetical protein AABM43_07860 [Actinomycetota bacterium]